MYCIIHTAPCITFALWSFRTIFTPWAWRHSAFHTLDIQKMSNSQLNQQVAQGSEDKVQMDRGEAAWRVAQVQGPVLQCRGRRGCLAYPRGPSNWNMCIRSQKPYGRDWSMNFSTHLSRQTDWELQDSEQWLERQWQLTKGHRPASSAFRGLHKAETFNPPPMIKFNSTFLRLTLRFTSQWSISRINAMLLFKVYRERRYIMVQ